MRDTCSACLSFGVTVNDASFDCDRQAGHDGEHVAWGTADLHRYKMVWGPSSVAAPLVEAAL